MPRPGVWYAMLAIGVALLALAGYSGYVLYPRFGLPAVSGLGLLILAAAAGIASFFSPCSFPLLATLLAREAGIERQTVRALRFAAALSLGSAIFLVLAGVAVAFGAGTLFAGVTFTSLAGKAIRTIIGMGLIALGLVQLGVIRVSFHGIDRLVRPLMRAQASERRERPTLGYAVLGFAYVLAGFGWSGPILVGLTGHALSMGGFEAALLAFLAAAAVVALLVFGFAFVVARAQDSTIQAVRARAGQVKRYGGYVLIAVGLWSIVLAFFAEFFARYFPV